jgi:hypothetical protein
VGHDYFGGLQPGCNLVPTRETRKALTAFGLIVGFANGRFTIYLDSNRLGHGSAEALAGIELLFRVTVSGQDFPVYTDLPMQPGAILYFSTNAAKGAAGGGPLTVNPQVSAADLLPLTTGSFLYQPAAPIAAGTKLQALDRGGAVVATMVAPKSGAIPIDVTPFGPGSYTLASAQAKQPLYAFLAAPALIGAASAGVISIFGGDVMGMAVPGPKTAKPAAPAAPAAPPLFQVTYAARSSAWRYDIFIKGPSAGAYSIKQHPETPSSAPGGPARPRRARGGPRRVTFKKVEAMPSPSCETSVAFESTTSWPMRARPAYRFQLFRGDRVIVETLPTPALSLNRSADGQGLCSRMFVHV